MTEVSDGLFLGNRKTSEDIAWLTAQGITFIVNATDDLPNCHSNIEYLQLGLEDVPSADLCGLLNDEDGVLTSLARSLSSGVRVLVHCRVGSSRSASIILAHFVKNSGLSLFDAFTQLRQVLAAAALFRRYDAASLAVNAIHAAAAGSFHQAEQWVCKTAD